MYDKYLSWMLEVCKPMKLPIETDLVGDVFKKVQENEYKKFFFSMKSGTLPLQTMSKISGKSIMFNKNPRAIDFMEKENLEILERKMKELDSSFKFAFSIDDIVKLKGIEHEDLHFESDEKLKKLLKNFESICEHLAQLASSSKTYRGLQFGETESSATTTITSTTPRISTAPGSRSSLNRDSSPSPTTKSAVKPLEFTTTPRSTVASQQEYEGQEDKATEMRKMKREIQELREQELKKLEKFIEDRKRDEERVIKNECSKVKQQMLNDIECERSELMSKIRQDIHARERELKQKMEENLEKEEDKIRKEYEARLGKKLAKEFGEEVNTLNLEIKQLREELNDKNLEVKSLIAEHENRVSQLEEERDYKLRRKEDEITELKGDLERLRRELASAKLNVEEMLKLKEEGELREEALSAQVVKEVGDDDEVIDDLEPLEEEEDLGLQLQVPKLQVAKVVSDAHTVSPSPKSVSPHQKGGAVPPPPPPTSKSTGTTAAASASSVSVKDFIERMSSRPTSLSKTNSSIKPKTIKDDNEEVIELQTPVLKKETTSTVIPKKEFKTTLKNMKDMY